MGMPQRRRFTVQEYRRMAEAGVFLHEERLELIRGVIRMMSAMGSRHASFVNRLTRALTFAVGDRAFVWTQSPVDLDDWSEPQPDVMILRPEARHYEDALPRACDALLVVEVCDSSRRFDRSVKGPLYAEAGLPEYWMLDVACRHLDRLTDPGPRGYRMEERSGPAESFPLVALPGVSIALRDILG